MKLNKNLLIPLLLVILFILFIFKNTSSQKPASPPPWDHKDIRYTIEKREENYLVRYTLGAITGAYYIGNSAIDLAPYVGKTVKIKGDFPKNAFDNETNEQCIKGTCHPIFTPRFWTAEHQVTPVVHIFALDEIE